MTDVAAAPQPPVGETARLDLVVLGGAGHVGLPLSLAFADAGLRVGIFDIDGAALERIAGGEMPFMGGGAEPVRRAVLARGRLELGTDAALIERADVVLLVIGTPVADALGPRMRRF